MKLRVFTINAAYLVRRRRCYGAAGGDTSVARLRGVTARRLIDKSYRSDRSYGCTGMSPALRQRMGFFSRAGKG